MTVIHVFRCQIYNMLKQPFTHCEVRKPDNTLKQNMFRNNFSFNDWLHIMLSIYKNRTPTQCHHMTPYILYTCPFNHMLTAFMTFSPFEI